MQAKNQAFKFGNDNTDETLAVVCLIWRTDHSVKNTTKNMSESCVHVCVRMQMLRIVQKNSKITVQVCESIVYFLFILAFHIRSNTY